MQCTKESLPRVAEAVVMYAKAHASKEGATIIALSGDLGAGKTTLVQHIARALGVEQTLPSPTFVIMRGYETSDPVFKRVVHIDAYRIESTDELRPLHLDSAYADTKSLVCIEWPEKLGETLPKRAIKITLTTVSENERNFETNKELQRALQDITKVV